MALSEQEEFELLSLEREKSLAGGSSAPAFQPNALQRRMGARGTAENPLKFGDVIDAVNHAGYNVGGAVTDAAAKILPPEGAAAAGYVANVATDAVPALIGGQAKALAPALEAGGRRLMQSALKPTWESLRTGKAADAITTMLEGGFNATKGGVEAMKGKIADLNQQITDLIANSSATIDKGAVASRLRDTLQKFELQVNPGSDVKAIQNAWDEFLQHPVLSGVRDIPVQLAQKMKQATYKALGSKQYGELKGAEVEAQKGLARGLKEEISTAVPETAPLNARESSLINASNVAERRALLQDNNNIGGLAWLSHDPLAAVGFMADKSALGKSILARSLYSGSEGIPFTTGSVLGGILGGLSGQPEEEGILKKQTRWIGTAK